jgi:predicted nucleotidyltransferase component of viral defense system
MKVTKSQLIERVQAESKGLSGDSKKNLLREILQEAILCHMKEVGLFEDMAFHGGTSLRLLHRIDRFSEDLDMSLVTANADYDIASPMEALKKSLLSSEINLEFQDKCKAGNPIKKFFINDSDILSQLSRDIGNVMAGEKIKIKLELDVLPSDHQVFVQAQVQSAFSVTVKAHDLSTCMGQKIHAVLCRGHFYGMDIIKGRDLYDLEWYLEKGIKPNVKNLKECLVRGGPWKDHKLTIDNAWIVNAIQTSVETKDFASILEDLKPLVDSAQFEGVSHRWTKDHFSKLTREKLKT